MRLWFFANGNLHFPRLKAWLLKAPLWPVATARISSRRIHFWGTTIKAATESQMYYLFVGSDICTYNHNTILLELWKDTIGLGNGVRYVKVMSQRHAMQSCLTLKRTRSYLKCPKQGAVEQCCCWHSAGTSDEGDSGGRVTNYHYHMNHTIYISTPSKPKQFQPGHSIIEREAPWRTMWESEKAWNNTKLPVPKQTKTRNKNTYNKPRNQIIVECSAALLFKHGYKAVRWANTNGPKPASQPT